MVNYKDLGLVNTREMFAKAIKGGYAIPAFNFNNMEQMQAIIQAAVECKSPVILQVSSGARKYANQTLLRYMAQGAVEYAKELGLNIPITLHLDHGDSFELCKSCIDMGFSSVMIDGSHLPYDENVALTEEEKEKMCDIVCEAGADYIKTSTGFSTAGANFHDVELMVKGVRGRCKVKAAGGISTVEDMETFLALGADRLGTSRAVKILNGEQAKGY